MQEPHEHLLSITVHVIPNSSYTGIVGWLPNGHLKIKLQSPATDNKANQSLKQLLAKTLQLSQKNITLQSGEKSRHKQVIIHLTPEAHSTWNALKIEITG